MGPQGGAALLLPVLVGPGVVDAEYRICGHRYKIADLKKPMNASMKSKYGSEGLDFGACSDTCNDDLQDRIIMGDLWGKFEDVSRMLNCTKQELRTAYNDEWENPTPKAAVSKFFCLAGDTASAMVRLMRDSGFDSSNHE